MKRIGIIGSRSRDSAVDYNLVRQVFFNLYQYGDFIVSGGCPQGGDQFAEKIARKYGIPIIIFFPDWERYGKQAGFIRNGAVAKAAHVMIACVARSRTGGTEDCLDKFQRLLKPNFYLV